MRLVMCGGVESTATATTAIAALGWGEWRIAVAFYQSSE